MRHQNVPVHHQRVLRADVPAMNRFEGTSSSSSKKFAEDHEIIGKVCKRAHDQHEVSAIFLYIYIYYMNQVSDIKKVNKLSRFIYLSSKNVEPSSRKYKK